MTHSFKQKFIGLFILTTLLFGNFSAFAQRRTSGQTNASVQKTSDKTAKTCDKGYQGTVGYTKIVSTSASGRNGSTRTMRREYTTQILIRDDGRPQGSAMMSADGGVNGSFNFTGRASASETETLNQIDISEKDEYCNITIKGRGNAQRVRCESTTNDQMQASGSNENTDVFVGLRGRTMVLSIGNLPKLTGEVSRQSSSKCSGTCTPTKPLGSSSSVETHNQGERSAATDENVIQFNPTSFNRLTGSWTRTSTDGNTTETFQWNLSRCAAPLEIGDIRFEHKKVPNPDRWVGFDPKSGTIDGNIVKIKAKVFNNGGDTAYANVKFSETKSGEQLADGAVSVAVKPGEAREVEYEWDTSGFAWNDNQTKESEREIKAELEGGNTEKAQIKIKPKPVIMVHGLWSNAAAWGEYPIYLRNAHSYDWNGYAVGADEKNGKMSTGDHPGNYKPTNTIFQNAQELGKQIKFARQENNAWHVDIVAHSMGGLISRQYINAFMAPVWDNKPEVTHLVMLGTPNQGSPCADLVDGIFKFFEQDKMEAMRELRPSVVADFNRRTTNRKGVKFSILIGYAIPQTCHGPERGDGVVPILSALYNISDRDYAFRDHISLTDDVNFKRFVLPRLAIGPKKARQEQNTAWLENKFDENYARFENQTEPNDRYGFDKYFQNASFKRGRTEQTNDANQPNITTRERIALGGRQSREIEIAASGKTGVIVVANAGVVATLTDASGAILGKSEGGMEVYKNPFRVIFPDKTPTGAMKLKLENLAAEETVAFVAAFAQAASASEFTVEAGKSNAAGTIPLTAKLIENNAPVVHAKVTGNLVGQNTAIEFFDDGKHNDGAANDGIYGASIEKLVKGEHFIEAKAEANNITRNAVAMINVGGANPAVKPAAKPRRKS